MHVVEGGGGTKLRVHEWGQRDAPPILFVHGWSAAHLCWRRQYESDLARNFRLVAFDLRGHGASEMPQDPGSYTDASLWAEDIAAIIRHLDLSDTTLVGWSYGGLVICDYLRVHGTGAVAGINFVGAAVTLEQGAFGTLIGPGFLDHFPGATADDLGANIQAIRAFVAGCTAHPLPRDEYETALAWNIVVPPWVRASLVQRIINSDDVLGTLDRPVLVTQGRRDTVILPAMAEHILTTCKTGRSSWYETAAHAPFLEDSERFTAELANFAMDAARGRNGALRQSA